MSKLVVGIVDYDSGNYASIAQSVRAMGFRVIVSSLVKQLDDTDLLILPGVGSFSSAMQSLNKLGLAEFLKDRFKAGSPILGICVGMQLLASSSDEFGFSRGLGLIPGKVVAFDDSSSHIGWNKIKPIETFRNIISVDSYVYFNHSYYFSGPPEFNQCLTEFNSEHFASVVSRDNLVGLQFHPEKSQQTGLILFKKLIVDMCNA